MLCTVGAQVGPDDVVQLLKGSVSAKRVAELAQNRGIDFQITPEVEGELREAGATDELLATLRRLAPKTATLVIESSPGGAHVYVDDEPVGTTSAEGRLKLTTLSPAQHRVRLSLDGYKDDSKDVALAAGAVLELKVTLEAKQAASAGVAAQAVERTSSQDTSGSRQQDAQAVVYIFQRNLVMLWASVLRVVFTPKFSATGSRLASYPVEGISLFGFWPDGTALRQPTISLGSNSTLRMEGSITLKCRWVLRPEDGFVAKR